MRRNNMSEVDKSKIFNIYNKVKEEKLDLDDLTRDELKSVLKLYNQEFEIIKDRIILEQAEINAAKMRIEEIINKE